MAFWQAIKTLRTKAVHEVAANSPGAHQIGDLVRRQREALALDLPAVGEALKIKPAYLAALEAGRPDQLPAPVYAIGFLRAYANHLGLDTSEIVRRFKQNPAGLGRTPGLAFPMPLGERSIPGGGMLLVAAILAICGYGAWYYSRSATEQSRPPRVAVVPAELLPPKSEVPVTRPTEAWADMPGSARDTPIPEQTPNPASETTGSSASRAIASVPAAAGAAEAATPAAALAPSSPPRQAGSVTAGSSARIMVHVVADSWVEIRDAGQEVLLARTLKAGETYGILDQPLLSMRTGNAGGLAITVDGNPAPSIGPLGAVRRNVILDPNALMAGTAVRRQAR